ncbi:MAG: helix-turn-helix domain-containing protein [Promethearchaeota archaeon]
MSGYNLSFLFEIGFSDVQMNVYKYLITFKFGTINEIKNNLKYSYSQVQNALLFLKKKNLIDLSSDERPHVFVRKNPKIALTKLFNERYRKFENNIQDLDKEIKIQETKYGRCVKDVTFYYYSDLVLGVDNLISMIDSAELEVVITSLPLSLLKRLEPSLYSAFMRGVFLKVYFSEADFEYTINYIEQLLDILRRMRIKIVQTEEKVCQVVRFNDEIVNMGNIFVDGKFLNSFTFREGDVLHFDGHFNPGVIQQVKKYLDLTTAVKTIEIEYPEPIKNILTIMEQDKAIKTRDLSQKSKISGAKLREILDYLISKGLVQEEIVQNERAGRPKRVYSLVE